MPRYVDLAEYLSHVCAVAAEHRFIPTGVAQRHTELSSTAFRAHDNMFPLKHDPSIPVPVTEEHRAQAKEIIEWAQRHYSKVVVDGTADSFERTVAPLLADNKFEIKFEAHIAGLYLAHRRSKAKTEAKR